MGDRGGLGNKFSAASPPDPRGGAAGIVRSRGMGTFTKRVDKEIKAPHTLEEEIDDHRNVEQMARLYHDSVAYPNMAGQRFVDEQARGAVLSGLKDVFNVMEFLRNKWLIFYRLYRGDSLAQYTFGRTNLHSPEPFKIVETIHPRVMRHLFGNERWFRMLGFHDNTDRNARVHEMLCRDQLRAMRFKQKASTFIRDGLIYGTAIQKCYWKQEFDEVRYRTGRRKPDPDFPEKHTIELDEQKSTELVFDGNNVENVSIFDFFTSPNASNVEEAEWCGDRSMWPDWKVKQMGVLGHWTGLGALKDYSGSNDFTFGDEFKERKSYAYGVFDPRESSYAPHIPHYEVIDWWGPLVIKDEKGSYETRMCNVVVIEPSSIAIIARVTVNPYWHRQKPYQAWRPIDLEDEFYGIGSLEPIARLSMEKDTKRNLLMAATQLEANPMWQVPDTANISDGQLLLEPGSVIRIPSPQDAILPLHVPQVSDAALKAENILTKDIRETAGTTSPQMGASDPFAKGKTATQHTSEVDEANLRLYDIIENWERDVGTSMLDQMVWNNQQFQSYTRVVREHGGLGQGFLDRYEVRPEDLLGRFLVEPIASQRLATKQTQVQQLVNLLDRAPIINQMYGPQAVKMPKLLAMILEQGFDVRNVSDFVSVPPEEAGLMTAISEHEMWYHGNVPPRRADDNDMRHVLAHMEEMKEERFEKLASAHPGIASRARAHVAEHQNAVALTMELQEKMMMEMAQQSTMMGQGGAGGGGPAGAAEPGQEPGSPQVRANENERGEGNGAKAEAGRGAPNAGAQ